MSDTPSRLPDVAVIGFDAPFRWLAQGWSDLMACFWQSLVYGLLLTAFSLWLVYALYTTRIAFWVFALTCGFVFVAPMLAMGLYAAGRMLEAGARPTLRGMLFVRSALRQDLAYLGLALLIIFLLWGQIAQIVYGLSTFQTHSTIASLLDFTFNTPAGHTMLATGTLVGGLIAFFAFTLVVVSAPMLLDQNTDVFIATVTSFRAVSRNLSPMLLWAFLLALLLLLTVFTGFLGLAIIFPWLGFASWRAYRTLVLPLI
jgi:uncharacterized membrane protein